MRMNTYTGKRFDPMQMTPEEVSLRDIAHALSLLCRGGGHMKYFYTVGLHSLNCAREAAARGWSNRLVLACLLLLMLYLNLPLFAILIRSIFIDSCTFAP